MEQKDKVTRENPGLEMTRVSKCISEKYKSLPAKKKRKYMYVYMESAQRMEYEQNLDEFYREQPSLISTPVSSTDHKPRATVGGEPWEPTTLY
jgi:upstream-binding transcription factor